MGDMPDCLRLVKKRKARKDHRCSSCGANITKGSPYLYISGIWSGEPNSYKLCNNCETVFDNFKSMDNDLCYEDGPSLDSGGVAAFLQGFLYDKYYGAEAAEDMAKRLGVPVWYTKSMIGVE